MDINGLKKEEQNQIIPHNLILNIPVRHEANQNKKESKIIKNKNVNNNERKIKECVKKNAKKVKVQKSIMKKIIKKQNEIRADEKVIPMEENAIPENITLENDGLVIISKNKINEIKVF